MSTPRCRKCGASTSQAENLQLSGMPTVLSFVYCSSCASVLGILDPKNIAVLLQQQGRVIDEIKASLAQVGQGGHRIENSVRHLEARTLGVARPQELDPSSS